MIPLHPLFRSIALLGLACLGGCDGSKSAAELAARDRQLAATADPAVTEALDDPIMTDRDLGVQDNSRRVRSVGGPAQAIYPPRQRALSGLDGLARGEGCESGFAYGKEWASRLPAGFGLYPDARLIEAAGNDKGGCRSRVVSFRAVAGAETILDWYRERATRSGYSARIERRGSDWILGGRRIRDRAAYYLIVSPRDGTSEASLITSGNG